MSFLSNIANVFLEAVRAGTATPLESKPCVAIVDILLKANAEMEFLSTSDLVALQTLVTDKSLKKPVRKATKAEKTEKTMTEAELMLPVDAPAPAPAPVPAPVTSDASDPLRHHAHRIKVIDANACQARKIDEANPIEGTRKGDAGATVMFWPEKQCSKKPLPGQKLCKICSEKDAQAKAEPTKQFKGWYGRLDETMYWNAKVLGCAHFFEKYPNGLLNDPSTRVTPVTPVVVEAPQKKAKKTKKADAVNSEKTDKTETEAETEKTKESLAVTDVTPKECTWLNFMNEGQLLIRNLKNDNVYRSDPSNMDPDKMAKRDCFMGRWVDGALDPYGEEVEDSE